MGCNQLILIRTDANSRIAGGHLMRCLSIAGACLRLGMKVWLLISDRESEAFAQSLLTSPNLSGLSLRRLPNADYRELERELVSLPQVLTEIVNRENLTYDSTVFLLDSYFAVPTYFTALKSFTGGQMKTAYLDDLRTLDPAVDLVINYDVISESSLPQYQNAYRRAGSLLLGASYTPLRPQFENTDDFLREDTLREKVTNILVTTGSSDPCHLCADMAWRFAGLQTAGSNLNGTRLHLVIGRYNEDRERLFSLQKKLPFLQLHENVSNMASLMKSCDLAVSAAGTTLYELCAAGIPSVSLVMADNQLACAKAFGDSGVLPCGGDIRTDREQVLQAVFSFMTDMSCNYEKRKTAHAAMKRLVDGNGALRLGKALKEL